MRQDKWKRVKGREGGEGVVGWSEVTKGTLGRKDGGESGWGGQNRGKEERERKAVG